MKSGLALAYLTLAMVYGAPNSSPLDGGDANEDSMITATHDFNHGDARFSFLEDMLQGLPKDKKDCSRKAVCSMAHDSFLSTSMIIEPFMVLRTLMEEMPHRKLLYPTLKEISEATDEFDCENIDCPIEENTFKEDVTYIITENNIQQGTSNRVKRSDKPCTGVFQGFGYSCAAVGAGCAIAGFVTAGTAALVCGAIAAGPCLGIGAGAIACDLS